MRYRFLRFPGGKYKVLTFSYDDGCRADIRLSGILAKYNLKATFNLNSGFLGTCSTAWHLTPEEVKKHIISNNHEIAVHGKQHIAPGNVPAKDGIIDVYECRKELENIFGGIIRGMAYPDSGIGSMNNGANLKDIETYLKMLGIVYSRTLGGDNNKFEMPKDWYAWTPTAHHNNPNLFEYLDEFIKLKCPAYPASARPKLFYLWGHAYEFDNNDNWNLIEEFCQKVSQCDDIWFATNIEIYDYVDAYNSLVFNTENTLVYNPTLKEIWFWADGKDYSVKPGETLKLD